MCAFTNLSCSKVSTISLFKFSTRSFRSERFSTSCNNGPTSPASKWLLSAMALTTAISAREWSDDSGTGGVHRRARCSSDKVNEILSLCNIESSWNRGNDVSTNGKNRNMGGEMWSARVISNRNEARKIKYRHYHQIQTHKIRCYVFHVTSSAKETPDLKRDKGSHVSRQDSPSNSVKQVFSFRL